ncbi:ATP-binding protein [Rhodococcus sp. AB351]|uniref:ATP-dependent nuclease n=1 Tax=Rhodococcus sp. AB351 TaxID=3413280 RepID=UPI00215A5DB6|nr:ATP-binding protein [Rhodococcus pyridinivorans]
MGDLIREIYIENFRSVRKQRFTTDVDLTPILGLNSAGKSNILRALDLFFNDAIEGLPISFDRDLSSHVPRGTKKKICVGIHLNPEKTLGLKGNKEFLERQGLSTGISIKKEWSLTRNGRSLQQDITFGKDLDSLRTPDRVEEDSLLSLVRSIRYHYVSNHVRPADKVKEVLEALRPEIMKEWKNSSKSSASILDELTAAANQMFAPVSDSVARGIDGLRISAAVPQDLADLAFELGMNAVANSEFVHDITQEGSGAQSFTLLHFLHLQDNAARKRNFGWVQASIWGLEEPESFLHAALRTRFATDLSQYAKNERRQVFITTHEDDFVRNSSSAVVVSPGKPGSTIRKLETREALAVSTKQRITSFRHPLMTHPDTPLVVVEGRTDKIYLTEAIRASNIRPRWILISPDEDLESGSSGDGLLNYVKTNKSALRARPDGAFILALKDWEDGSKSGPLDRALREHPHSKSIVCPTELCNPNLGETFVGIERYLPTELIQLHADKRKLNTNMESGVIGIDRRHLDSLKPKLAQAISQGEFVGKFMIELVKWIDRQVEDTLTDVPIEVYLGP